jgi:hypothetical protein
MKYSLKELDALAESEPIYGYPRGFKCWLKRMLGFKVEKVFVCNVGQLQEIRKIFWYNPRHKMQQFVDTYGCGVKII